MKESKETSYLQGCLANPDERKLFGRLFGKKLEIISREFDFFSIFNRINIISLCIDIVKQYTEMYLKAMLELVQKK